MERRQRRLARKPDALNYDTNPPYIGRGKTKDKQECISTDVMVDSIIAAFTKVTLSL